MIFFIIAVVVTILILKDICKTTSGLIHTMAHGTKEDKDATFFAVVVVIIGLGIWSWM